MSCEGKEPSSPEKEKSARNWKFGMFKDVPVSTVVKTVSLWTCFFSIAFPDSVRGPTFLDVRDAVGISTQEMSYTFTFTAMGGLLGCLAGGLILDRFSPASRHVIIFMCGCFVAVCSALLPFSWNLHAILGNSLVLGFCNGLFHTCANIVFLELWRGYNSSPAMYALHFSYGVGSLLSPIVAKPFLSKSDDQLAVEGSDIDLAENILADNTTAQNISQQFSANQSHVEGLSVKLLFPLLGVQLVVMVLPHLFFFYSDRRSLVNGKEAESSLEVEEDRVKMSSVQKLTLLVLMFLLYFCFSGIEISYRTFISTFTVSIGNSRQVGSDVTALFYLSFTLVRGLAVPGGALLSSSTIMWSSQALCLVGAVILSVWAASSFLAIQIGTLCIGAGSAFLFPAGILWLKDSIIVSSRVGALLIFAMNISAQIYCIFIGYVIDQQPIYFVHLMTVTACSALLIFFACSSLLLYIRKTERKRLEMSL